MDNLHLFLHSFLLHVPSFSLNVKRIIYIYIIYFEKPPDLPVLPAASWFPPLSSFEWSLRSLCSSVSSFSSSSWSGLVLLSLRWGRYSYPSHSSPLSWSLPEDLNVLLISFMGIVTSSSSVIPIGLFGRNWLRLRWRYGGVASSSELFCSWQQC